MKTLFFTFLFSFSALAVENEVCDYLKKNTFEEVASKISGKPSKKLTELTIKVSKELNEKISQCKEGDLSAVYDYDTCSNLCFTHGSSQFRQSALIVSRGVIDVNEETRDCQKLCAAYQLVAFTYRHGLKAKSSDCSEDVVNSDRGQSKADLVNHVKEEKKSDASKQ